LIATMSPKDLPNTLAALFGDAVQALSPGSYQVETEGFRLLVLLSEAQDWLRVLIPIAPSGEALPFLEEILEANFDHTQENRYAIAQDLLWGVFQQGMEALTPESLTQAIERLVVLHQQGINEAFRMFTEKRVREIIRVAKRQGQTLESTMQTLSRFYEEGVMGDVADNSDERSVNLEAWRYQMEKLWDEVDP
jgi:Tir chaperone protein (CesT) family